jgi:hypothetical protein
VSNIAKVAEVAPSVYWSANQCAGRLGSGDVVPGVEERVERGFLAGFGHRGREDAEGDWRVWYYCSGMFVGVKQNRSIARAPWKALAQL